MSDYLDTVRQQSQARFDELKLDLASAEHLVGTDACVYATGSFGRLEAGAKSDLDLFIVVNTREETKDGKQVDVRCLSGLSEIKLKYHLVCAVEGRKIPDFDGDGKYLKVHTVKEYTENLGSPHDDSKNTFTGRLLMLLESRPLLGSTFFEKALSDVISAYFIDFDDNADNFIPAFLVNDILRMWRTFCVNYEFYRTKGSIKSKIKNLKLKHSRMLTCYSAVIYLLLTYARKGTVTPDVVRGMVALTPTERLHAASDADFAGGPAIAGLTEELSRALNLYAAYLELVHKGEEYLEQQFKDNEKQLRTNSRLFGRKLAEIMELIDPNSEHHALYRFILI